MNVCVVVRRHMLHECKEVEWQICAAEHQIYEGVTLQTLNIFSKRRVKKAGRSSRVEHKLLEQIRWYAEQEKKRLKRLPDFFLRLLQYFFA